MMLLVNPNGLVRVFMAIVIAAPLIGFADWATTQMDRHRNCNFTSRAELVKAGCLRRIVHVMHTVTPDDMRAYPYGTVVLP